MPTAPTAPGGPSGQAHPPARAPAAATPSPPAAGIVNGVDVEAVAAAVRACPGVEGLHPGSPGEIATYLPGRRVAGVQIGPDAVLVQVRSRWGVPAGEVAAQIRLAVAALARRPVDVTIGDIGDPRKEGHPLNAL